jgi:hypothetical protein
MMQKGEFYTIGCKGLTILGVVSESSDSKGIFRGWEIHLGYKGALYGLSDATRDEKDTGDMRVIKLVPAAEEAVRGLSGYLDRNIAAAEAAVSRAEGKPSSADLDAVVNDKDCWDKDCWNTMLGEESTGFEEA